MNPDVEKVIIRPEGSLGILSYQEALLLCDVSSGGLNDILRQCALAVLNTGTKGDSGLNLLEAHSDFEIEVINKGRGVQIILQNPPAQAFVEGEMITGIKQHLYTVLRDLVYARNEIFISGHYDLKSSLGITNAVFHMVRNANLLLPDTIPNVVVCWGGHSIPLEEYRYSKRVGYQLGLRRLDICTGCGPGAMKGPMKGAVLGHGKQRYLKSRYIGVTEPGIIAAEPPNGIVTELCILPDIEKRLEAFMRLGHGIIIFPGGPGTMEEILYLLAILLHPKNADIPVPIILTGPESSTHYFNNVIAFIDATLGKEASNKLTLMVNQPEEVACKMKQAMVAVRKDRRDSSDAYYFNWRLHITLDLQVPFNPTHENMANLNLHKDQPVHHLASQLRKAFSGIVSGNVKAEGIMVIQKYGPYEIQGDVDIMQEMDAILESFVKQSRMKIDASTYNPCYKIIHS